MEIKKRIEIFFESTSFGVAGASSNRNKYGNKILRCYLQHGKTAVPINPHEKIIENQKCVARVLDLSNETKSLSVITPPKITEQIVEDAIKKGIKNIWMQPGAESPLAVKRCEDHGINVIADGSCLLVVLGYT